MLNLLAPSPVKQPLGLHFLAPRLIRRRGARRAAPRSGSFVRELEQTFEQQLLRDEAVLWPLRLSRQQQRGRWLTLERGPASFYGYLVADGRSVLVEATETDGRAETWQPPPEQAQRLLSLLHAHNHGALAVLLIRCGPDRVRILFPAQIGESSGVPLAELPAVQRRFGEAPWADWLKAALDFEPFVREVY